MARFTIHSKDGKTIRHIGEPQYSGSYMGVDFVEFRAIYSPTPIEWQIGDYVDYHRTGLRYKLFSLPQPKKVARRGEYGAAFEYSNVQFYAATKELEIAPFRDVVARDNKIHFSTRADVSTFEDVHGIARRIQECMDDIFPDSWRIEVYESDDDNLNALLSETKEFSVSGGSCLEALSQIYETWKNVGWIHTYDSANDINVITIGRANVRDAENTSDAFVYGMGNGLTSIKKATANEGEFATRLYVYGSERNIQTRYYNGKDILNKDSVDIRNLMLPLEEWGKTDGLPDARKAFLQADDAIVEKYGLIPRTIYFDGNENEEIYPSIVGLTEGKVRAEMIALGEGDSEYLPPDTEERLDKVVSESHHDDNGDKESIEKYPTFILFINQLGFNLAEQGKLTSEGQAVISMKSGACAGREFVVRKHLTDFTHPQVTLERFWDESLGMGFPNNIYPIKSGDEFAILDIPMPEFYITLAEDRVLEAGRKKLEDYTRVSAYYEPGINSIKIREGKILKAGMYMQVQDEDIIDTADNKDYVLIDSLTIDEKSEVPIYKVTLREQKRSARNYAALEDMIEDSREIVKKETERARQYTDRRFRSAQETLSMLEGAFKNFSEGVNPVTVRTMALLIGDESLQFKFTNGANSLEDDICPLAYDTLTKRIFSMSESYIRHMTLGIDTITSPGTRGIETYKGWKVDSFEYAFDDTEARYVYIKAREDSDSAEFVLSKTSIGMTDVVGYYHFLVGILNSEYNGSRDFVTLYGFTEVLPGQITTDIIRSADGKTYFDLAKSTIGGNIKFVASDGKEKSMSDYADEQNVIIQNVQDQIDGVVENYYLEGAPTIDNYPAIEWDTDVEKLNHVGDVYINIATEEQDPDNAGKAWRWCICGEEENLGRYKEIVVPSGTIVKDEDTLVGKLNTSYAYINVQLNNQTSKDFVYGQYIEVYSGPPVKVRIDTDGSVYIYDQYGRYTGETITLKFYHSEALRAIDKDGNEVFLHWHPIADTDGVKALLEAYKAQSGVDELQYLKGTFAKGKTEIAGGVVLTEMVAVTDGNNENIEAFINGSEFGKDDEHGKLLIAAGIEDIEKPEEAKTRVYEDGTVETERMKLRDGCEIGDLVIENNRLSVGTKTGGYIRISKGGLEAVQKDGSYTQLGTCASQALWVEGKDSHGGVCYTNEDTYKIAAMINAAEGYHAIHCRSGVYAGLRPNIRVITSNTPTAQRTLDDLDHTLVINNSSAITITLPSSPQEGQTYRLIHPTNVAVTINWNGYPAINVATGNTPGNPFSVRRSVVLTYCNGTWYAEYTQLSN